MLKSGFHIYIICSWAVVGTQLAAAAAARIEATYILLLFASLSSVKDFQPPPVMNENLVLTSGFVWTYGGRPRGFVSP